MSMFVNSVSFWRQNQNWYAGRTNASPQFFGGGNFGSQTDIAIAAATAAMSALASATTNYYMESSILAAKQGVARVNKAAEAKNGGTSKPVGDIGNQVTFSGALAGLVNFGADGPSASGGFQFVTGSKLTDAFNLAMLAEKSHGSAIDTVSVTGNTLTASTSGADAHPVFTLTLHPNSGLWTFKLINPIDGLPDKTDSFMTALNLSGLMQAVKSNGQTIALPNNIIVNIYGDQNYASGTATRGSVHQGGLVYKAPATTASPITVVHRPPYRPPINPLTGYAYVTTSSLSAANGAAVNIFA